MDGEEQMNNAEDMEDYLDPEDILQVIELDDSGAIPDALVGLNVDENEADDNDATGEEHMEEIPAEVKDMSELVFAKHSDAVFSVSLDPKTMNLAVTGGQDDKAFVWEVSTGNVLFECTGHKDSVTCTGFSHDGTYVATADLGGLIKVWKVQTKEEVFSFECSDAEWLRWHPAAQVLFLGTVDGDVWMWKIPSGECKTMSNGCTSSCGLILGDGKRACIGYEDGSVKIWDLKSGSVEHTVSGSAAHKSTVISMGSQPDGKIIITGSTDVTAKIINTANGKLISTLDCSSGGDNEENSVECVGISPIQSFAATGTVEGLLSIWDLNNQTCRLRCEHGSGIVGLQWDRLSPLVYTTCLDGVVRLWDSRSGELASKWTGHTDSVLGFDISKDSNIMVTVSEDNTARVFSLNSPDR